MDKYWVVVANAAEAKIFSRENRSSVSLAQTLTHPESKLKASEIASDRPGHNQSKGNGRGSFGEPNDPKAFEADRFAAELAAVLDKGRTARQYEKLIIAASPHFHGLLNKHINKHVADLVEKHIEKDLTSVPVHEFANKLNEYL